MLVIDSDGTKLGILPTRQAQDKAAAQGLNLVEVAPNVRPPVCRILDYGKYKYDQKQDAKRKKKNQVTIEIKEVKFRPKVDKHDFDFKVRHCVRFLSEGNKVKCTIMFRGREMAHTELGRVVLERVLGELDGKVVVDSPPKMEGRNMHMQISPRPGAWPKKPKNEGADAASDEKKNADDKAAEAPAEASNPESEPEATAEAAAAEKAPA